jgi:hypothetical protein
MQPRVAGCRALGDYKLWLRFEDGAQGTVDLSRLRGRGVFAAWDDPAMFARASIDPETGAVCWPGGVDLDPYVLYSQVTGASLPGSGSKRASA